MIKRLFKLLLLVVVLLPFNVMAKCDDARLSDLSSIAGNVRFSTTYRLQGNEMIYNVELSNLTDDIYVIDSIDNVFTPASFNSDYESLDNMNYTIYSNDPNCYGEELLSKIVNVPRYNNYVGSDICKKYPNDSYCQLWGVPYFYIESDFVDAVVKQHTETRSNSHGVRKESNIQSHDYLPIYIFSTVIVLTFVFIIFVVRRKRK